MKKPSKVLSMVLAVMMVMSSFAGLTGLNAKAAGTTYQPGDTSNYPNATKATLNKIEDTDEVILVDEEGKEIAASTLTVEDVIGAASYDFYKYGDKGELKKLESASSIDTMRDEAFALQFVKPASTSFFDIKEIRVYADGAQVDTLTDPKTEVEGHDGSYKYTYTGLIYNALTSKMTYSFKFVVTAKTLDFSTDLDKSFDKIAEVGLVDENNKLEYGKDFEFTLTPTNGYAFNDLGNNKVKVNLYSEDGKVAVDGEQKELLSNVSLTISRTGLYTFKIAANDVNKILNASYKGNASYLSVSNTFDNEDLDANIVKTGDFIEASVTKEVPGKGSVEVKGLTEGKGSAAGKSFIKPGTPVELTAKPQEGYKLVDVKVDNLDTSKGEAKVEVSKDGTTATILFDANVALASGETQIEIKPVFEQTATIKVVNDGGKTGVLGSLSVDGNAVTEAKVNSNDDFELTLKLTTASVKDGKVLNPTLKTIDLYVKTILSSTTAGVNSDDVIVLNYDRTDEDGNFIFKINFNAVGSSFDSNIANDNKSINFGKNIVLTAGLSNGSPTVYSDYCIDAADTVKAYFYFSDLKALGQNGTVEVFGKDGNEEYADNQTGQALKVGETYQVKITPDPKVNQPLLNVTYYKSEEEVKDFKINYTKDSAGKDTDVVESYTFTFTVENPTDANGDLTKANYFKLNFAKVRQSEYVSFNITGEGSITLEKSNGDEYDIATLDTELGQSKGEATVYIVPEKMENLESLTVEKVTTDVTGATKKEPVEITPAGDAYKVKLEQDADAKATFVITAKFKEAAKSYLVINGTPYDKSKENGGYLSLTLPNLGQKEVVYAGQEITVSAVPNEKYKVGQVLVYIADNHDGIVLNLSEDESATGVYNGSYTLTDADAENAQYVKFVAKFDPVNPDDPDFPEVTNEWAQNGKGEWSYVDKNGEKLKGWHDDIPGWEGQWFYFNDDGIMAIGWHDDIPGWKGQYFYFDPKTGVMQTGWLTNVPGWEGKWFYFNPVTGVMKGDNDWLLYNGKWYFFNSDGTMVETGWSLDMNSGKWYYFGKDGAMLTNTWTPDGYYVGSDGAWIPGYKG